MCACVAANKEFHGSWSTDKDFLFIRKANKQCRETIRDMLVTDNSAAGSLITIAAVADGGAPQTHFQVRSCSGSLGTHTHTHAHNYTVSKLFLTCTN